MFSKNDHRDSAAWLAHDVVSHLNEVNRGDTVYCHYDSEGRRVNERHTPGVTVFIVNPYCITVVVNAPSPKDVVAHNLSVPSKHQDEETQIVDKAYLQRFLEFVFDTEFTTV